MGMTVTNQNLICEEIKSRLNSENVSYHLVQNLLSSCLPSKTINIKIYKTVTFTVVLCGYETWFLILREELRLRVSESEVLRKIFRPLSVKLKDCSFIFN